MYLYLLLFRLIFLVIKFYILGGENFIYILIVINFICYSNFLENLIIKI